MDLPISFDRPVPRDDDLASHFTVEELGDLLKLSKAGVIKVPTDTGVDSSSLLTAHANFMFMSLSWPNVPGDEHWDHVDVDDCEVLQLELFGEKPEE